MSRFGLDIALDTLGIIRGIIAACIPSTTYNNGTSDFDIGFVDDSPAVGWMKFNGALVEATDINFNMGGGSSWVLETEINPGLINDQSDYLMIFQTLTASRFFITYSQPTDRLNVVVSPDGGATFPINTFLPQPVAGNTAILNITSVAGIWTITWDGVSSAPFDLSSEANINFTGIRFAAQGVNQRPFEVRAKYFNFSLVDNWNLENRLWEENDPNVNKIIGSLNSVEMALIGLSILGTVFPYELDGVPVEGPTAFRVSDNPCVTGTPLTFGGELMTSEGAFMTTGGYSVEYVKDVFI